MSNFADRLLARSVGAPLGPGLSLLAPRPVSRFEAGSAFEVETASETSIERADERVAARPIDPMHANEMERRAANGSSTAMPAVRHGADPAEAGSPAPSAPVADQTPRSPIARLETAAIRPETWTAKTHLAEPTPDVDAPKARPIEQEVPDFERDPMEQPMAPSPARLDRFDGGVDPGARMASLPAAPKREASAEPPPPAISIGKIEVQFLPEETRKSVSPSPPQRTRGFEAYARARRGVPR
jgi:hypothetical protein